MAIMTITSSFQRLFSYCSASVLRPEPLATCANNVLSAAATLAYDVARLCGNLALFGTSLLKIVAQEAAPLAGRVAVSAALTGVCMLATNCSSQLLNRQVSDIIVGSLSVMAGAIVAVADKSITNTVIKHVGNSEFPIMSNDKVDRVIRWIGSTGTTFAVLYSTRITWSNVLKADKIIQCPDDLFMSGDRLWRWTAALLTIPIFTKMNNPQQETLKFKYSTIATAIIAEVGVYLYHYCTHIDNKEFFCLAGTLLAKNHHKPRR